jgi:hypothetical protein
MAAYRVAIVSALLAVLAESPTMDVRPESKAPYVSCASGYRSVMPRVTVMSTHRLGDRSITGDLSVLHEHVGTGNSDICELRVSYDDSQALIAYLDVTIINTITSHLLSDITYVDSR